MKVFLMFDKIVGLISRAVIRVSAVALFIIAAVSFVDMIGRYFFMKSLSGAQDMVELTMCIFLYAGLGMAIRKRRLIMVPVVLDLMKERYREIIIAAGNLACFAMSILIISQLYQSTLTMFGKLLVGTAILRVPHAPFYAFATFGFIMIALELLIVAIKGIYGKPLETADEKSMAETARGGAK